MAKKEYSKEEKLSFKKGMQAQYSKEHPLMRYVFYVEDTFYKADGSLDLKMKGREYGCKTKKEAQARVDNFNNDVGTKNHNSRVLKAVKEKKVDVHSSDGHYTRKGFMKKVKPFRQKESDF